MPFLGSFSHDLLLPLALIGGMPGWAEIMVILAVVLLLFGNRLPTVARNLGRSFVEFKRGVRSDGTEEETPQLPQDGETPKHLEQSENRES